MLVDYEKRSDDVLAGWLIPFWVATKGARFATEALVKAAVFKRAWHVRVNKTPGWFLGRGDSQFGLKHRPLSGWGGLRAELAHVTAAEYESARAYAEEVRASASLGLRCAISYAFTTEVRWADEDVRACLASVEYPHFGTSLVAAANADVAVAVARSCPAWEVSEEVLCSGLDALGEGFVPVLTILFSRGDAELSARVARVLSLVESEDAAQLFASALADTKLRRLAEGFFHQYPGLAARSFACTFGDPAAPGRGVAASLWYALSTEHQPVVERAAERLDGPSVAVLAELRRMGAAEAEEQSSPERRRMAEVWQRIETWLNAHHPATVDMLSAPAAAEDVQTLEATIGRSLPETLRASLMVHNGESDEPVGLFYGYQLLSTSQILDEWTTMRDVAAGWSKQRNTSQEFVKGVQPRHWHVGWIPIAGDGGGNFFCVDADPAPGGHLGQVLFFDHELGPEHVAARDLEEWLIAFARKLEAGAAKIWSSGAVSDEPDPEA
jgi:cell wall assembly regulator SMI1